MDKVLVDVYIDQEALRAQLKVLRMVALLDSEPLLKDLVDLLKFIDTSIDTERAKTARAWDMEQYRNNQHQKNIKRMMEEAKQGVPTLPWDSGTPWSPYPISKATASYKGTDTGMPFLPDMIKNKI